MLKIGTPVRINISFSQFNRKIGKVIDIRVGVLRDMFKIEGKVFENIWFFEHQLEKLEVKTDGPRPFDI